MLPYINPPFEYVAELLGASTDDLKLIFSFLLSYPLAAVFKRLPDTKPWTRNLFTISVSLFYLVGLFDLWAGLRTVVLSSGLAYAIAHFIDGLLMPWIGFVVLMGHMSVNHIYRQMLNDPSIVDITGAQMVLVMKLTAFCWNVHDGRLPEKDLSDTQKDRAIREMPSYLDFAGYVLFFPSLNAGPAFDYNEYRRFLDNSMFDLPAGVDQSKAAPTRKKRRIPRSGTPATIKAIQGILYILAFLQFSKYYYPGVILEAEYVKFSLPRRVFIMHMVGLAARMKYYGVWFLTEGACILSGIGFNGVDPKTGRAKWDRLQNVNPVGLELAQNSRAYLGSWNMNTNNWLRNYMYLRVTPKGKKPGFRASMATFVTSAFWHGFYPGYYMAFVLASFIQTVAKNCRRLIRPLFMTATAEPKPLPSKRYYDILSWLITQLAFSFTVMPFLLLTIPASFIAWARVYFYCVIGVALMMGVFASPAKAYLKKRQEKRTRPGMTRAPASKHRGSVGLGVPDDPGQDLDEIMDEIQAEVRMRQAKGQSLAEGLQEAVQDRLKNGALSTANETRLRQERGMSVGSSMQAAVREKLAGDEKKEL